MSQSEKTTSTTEAWETGQLGEDAAHAKVAPDDTNSQIDEILGLQMISIRLEKSLIDSYKLIGEYHGLGYQPLMKDVLKRFADSEARAILRRVVESQRKAQDPKAPTPKPQTKMKKAA
jgi:uncharacterized protein (DUF4415 family)